MPVGLGQLVAEAGGPAVEIREDGDGVLRAERGERLSPGGGQRRDGELQPRLPRAVTVSIAARRSA